MQLIVDSTFCRDWVRQSARAGKSLRCSSTRVMGRTSEQFPSSARSAPSSLTTSLKGIAAWKRVNLSSISSTGPQQSILLPNLFIKSHLKLHFTILQSKLLLAHWISNLHITRHVYRWRYRRYQRRRWRPRPFIRPRSRWRKRYLNIYIVYLFKTLI